MKVLMISNTDGALYNFRKPIIESLIKAGHEVVAISGDSEEGDYFELLKKIGVRIYFKDFSKNSINFLLNLRIFYFIYKVIKKENPDIVHGFTHKPNIYGTLASRLLRIDRVFVTITGLGAVFIRSDIKSMILRRILILLYQFVLNFSKNVFFQNIDDMKYFEKNSLTKKNQAVLTNGSGIDLTMYEIPSNKDEFVARQILSKDLMCDMTDKKIILYPARAAREKGFFEFYQAARILNDSKPNRYIFLHLGFMSTDFFKNLLDSDIENLINKSGVKFLGYKKNIKDYMSASHVVVLPSYREGTSRSLIEAIAMGKCVVATNVPGCREVVMHGENGYLCEPGDVNSLVKAISKIDDDLILKSKDVSRTLCELNYDVRYLVELTLDKYFN
jgi:N,N'-diacetylbacillosaminyl-diphospho-undecaprenol alpha-1,3-N-acetylgalactosaminyltransferase